MTLPAWNIVGVCYFCKESVYADIGFWTGMSDGEKDLVFHDICSEDRENEEEYWKIMKSS